MPDWISQHEFDDYAGREQIMMRAWFMGEHTVWLGEPGGTHQELDLLQHMIRANLADCKTGDDGLIYYRAKR